MDEKTPCILLGVTGCIAAYKSCEIIRSFQKAGARVKVVMSKHATSFIGATTFRALTQEPVAVDLFDEAADPIQHISLARECDVFLVAPATANFIAKLAHGIADDLISTTALAVSAPIIVAPAMNQQMYDAQATQENFSTLVRRGVSIIDAEEGYLACGDEGRGRLADIDKIVQTTLTVLKAVCDSQDKIFDSALSDSGSCNAHADLEGLHIMVTAGPTIEPIDSVRYISNRSSGKMGYAIARAAEHRGAQVDLISGPVALDAPLGVHTVRVQSAEDMLDAAKDPFKQADIAIFCAAVADVRPASTWDYKLKKGMDNTRLASIELVENPDILTTLAREKRDNQCVVGFAAETDNVVENAQAKLASKGADIIVANDVSNDAVFGCDDNQVWIIDNNEVDKLDPMSKDDVANAVLDAAKSHLDLS